VTTNPLRAIDDRGIDERHGARRQRDGELVPYRTKHKWEAAAHAAHEAIPTEESGGARPDRERTTL